MSVTRSFPSCRFNYFGFIFDIEPSFWKTSVYMTTTLQLRWLKPIHIIIVDYLTRKIRFYSQTYTFEYFILEYIKFWSESKIKIQIIIKKILLFKLPTLSIYNTYWLKFVFCSCLRLWVEWGSNWFYKNVFCHYY